jgi:Ran GTPase-activating protein (RanGAP) involved in mRNA processing and transport
MIQLIKFMSGREQFKKINLRKNKIGDEGAKELAKFISDFDTTLVDMNLNRNRITEAGI